MRRQPFQKNPHILRVCSGFFEKLSLPKTKISHFEIGSTYYLLEKKGAPPHTPPGALATTILETSFTALSFVTNQE
jgi:hypothetical protein